MSTVTPPELVAGAPRVQLPFGMFSYLAPRENSTDHWQGGGATWEYLDPFTVEALGQVQNPQSDTFGLPKNLDRTIDSGDDEVDPGFTAGLSFGVYGHFVATPVAWSPETVAARAVEVLLAFEERQVEHVFWTGSADNTPNLADPVSLGSFSTADVFVALGELETYIGDTYGSLGVMHMSRRNALMLLHNGTLVVSGSRLSTALGTPVVAGSGYTSDVMKASPAIFGYRSEIFTSSDVRGDLLDKSQNNLYGIAERTYLLGFDPTGVAAVTITA
jgi:hypothetical protein